MIKVLFVERCLSDAEDNVVLDHIRRIGTRVSTHVLSVCVGSFPALAGSGITSVRCQFFPKIEGVKSWLFSRAALRAYEENDGFGVDVIHAHFAYPEGSAARTIGLKHGIPYVVTGRGDDVLLYPERSGFLMRSVRAVLTDAAAFIGVSRDICSVARDLGARADRCHHIPHGIRNDIFHLPPDRERDGGPRTILFAGAFLPVKNVVRMCRAFGIVVKSRDDVRFVLAGEGPLRGGMAAAIAAGGISERVEFLGHVTPRRLAEAMQAADVLCLPSVSEGWPNVVMEAMACGTPVVGANVGGVREQITADETGMLCDPGSADDIAGKLLEALDREWDRSRISERGRMYTRDGAAKGAVGVYEEVLRRCAG